MRMVLGRRQFALGLGLGLTTASASLPTPAIAQQASSFSAWLSDFRQEAASAGISQSTLDAALSGISPISRVVELDRHQPEGRMTFTEYLNRTVNDQRVNQGRRLGERHRDVLEAVSARFGVQPRFILSLWGVESSYGENTGGFSVIGSLATLAYDGRRADFFRSELIAALRILDQGHINVESMQGSWAGAMGQSQFMPSSFLEYAVDFDGNGRRDIWNSEPDVFASAANYLSSFGWSSDTTWGRRVTLPSGFDTSQADLDIRRSLAAWGERGVRREDGSALPAAALEASLVLPGGGSGPAFLVYGNYRVLLRWNRSSYFATSVGILADRIGECRDTPAGMRCVL